MDLIDTVRIRELRNYENSSYKVIVVVGNKEQTPRTEDDMRRQSQLRNREIGTGARRKNNRDES